MLLFTIIIVDVIGPVQVHPDNLPWIEAIFASILSLHLVADVQPIIITGTPTSTWAAPTATAAPRYPIQLDLE